MPFSFFFESFLRSVMIGAGSVFALLLAVGVGMPRRADIRNTRQSR